MHYTLVPYRPGVNLWRARGCRLVLNHLEPLRPLRIDDDPTRAFNKSATINNAVAQWSDESILVLNDADSIVPHTQLDAMIRGAATGQLMVGYTDYLRLTQQATFEAVEKDFRGVMPDWPKLDLEWAQQGAPSIGVCAIKMRSFRQVGGFDERFEGWGPEDIDFAERCLATVGVERIPGPLYHLWHDERRPDDSPVSSSAAQVERNRQLFVRKHSGAAA